jgi:hypothetical protein
MDSISAYDFTYTLVGLTASFVFFGFYLRKEALDFQKDYLDRATETGKRIEARFREKSVSLIMSLISGKDTLPTEDDLRNKFKDINFAEQIKSLSKIILEIEELMRDFRKVHNYKNRFANLWFAVGAISGVNWLGFSTSNLQLMSIIFTVDVLLFPLGYVMYDFYRTYSNAEQKFISKVEKEAMTGILNIT